MFEAPANDTHRVDYERMTGAVGWAAKVEHIGCTRELRGSFPILIQTYFELWEASLKGVRME